MKHDQALLALATERVQQCIEAAEAKLINRFPVPSVTLNQRGKIAGSAHLQRNLIKLHPVLFHDNQQAFIDQVIPHEVCHLLAFQLYGKVRPHGSQWRYLMHHVFQLTPEVKHQFDVTKVAGKTFEYHCQCGVIALSIRRHNKVTSGQQQYCCRRCSMILRSVAKTSA